MPAAVVVGAPDGTVEVGAPRTVVGAPEPGVAVVDVAAVEVVVFALLGNREGPPAAVVVGAMVLLTAAVMGMVVVVPATAPLPEVATEVVVVEFDGVVFFGSEVTQGSTN